MIRSQYDPSLHVCTCWSFIHINGIARLLRYNKGPIAVEDQPCTSFVIYVVPKSPRGFTSNYSTRANLWSLGSSHCRFPSRRTCILKICESWASKAHERKSALRHELVNTMCCMIVTFLAHFLCMVECVLYETRSCLEVLPLEIQTALCVVELLVVNK